MIQVKNLSKQFKAPTEEKGLFGPKKKPFWAVKDLNFEITKGSVASILGPNGCVKTTTLRMIAGMLTPSRGTVFVDSVDVRKDKQTVKSKIGYMTNNTSLYDRLSVIETVKFFEPLLVCKEANEFTFDRSHAAMTTGPLDVKSTREIIVPKEQYV